MFKAEQLVDNSFGREAKITEKAIKKKKQTADRFIITIAEIASRLHMCPALGVL